MIAAAAARAAATAATAAAVAVAAAELIGVWALTGVTAGVGALTDAGIFATVGLSATGDGFGSSTGAGFGASTLGSGLGSGLGFGGHGAAGPVGDDKTFGRISAIALRGMPSFGSGPDKARSKREVSLTAGAGFGNGRGKTSILGWIRSIWRAGTTGNGARALAAGAAVAAAGIMASIDGPAPSIRRFTRHAANAPRK